MTDSADRPCFALPPYARALGITLANHEDGVPVLHMELTDHTTGRPGYLHGGAMGGMLEMAAIGALQAELTKRGLDLRPKPVNISIEYLRGGTNLPTFAKGQVVRAGRRVANVRAEVWQADRALPIASCWINFLLAAPKP